MAAALWLFLAAVTVREGRVKSAASALPTSSVWSASPTLTLGSRGIGAPEPGSLARTALLPPGSSQTPNPDGVQSS